MRFRVLVTLRAASQAEAHSRTASVESMRPGCLSYPIESSRSCGQGWKSCSTILGVCGLPLTSDRTITGAGDKKPYSSRTPALAQR